jgi:hypothetical protein
MSEIRITDSNTAGEVLTTVWTAKALNNTTTIVTYFDEGKWQKAYPQIPFDVFCIYVERCKQENQTPDLRRANIPHICAVTAPKRENIKTYAHQPSREML